MARSRRNVPQPKEHSALSVNDVSKSYGSVETDEWLVDE